MTANPAADLTPYIKTLKEDRYKRELLLELEKAQQSTHFDINKIQEHINSFENITSASQNKKIDEDFSDKSYSRAFYTNITNENKSDKCNMKPILLGDNVSIAMPTI